MKYKWLGKNASLDRLTEVIGSFLEERRFKVIRQSCSDSHHLVGVLRLPSGELRKVRVTVSGDPHDFLVELQAGEETRSILKFSSLFSYFGGGALMLKGHKSGEFYQEFEEDFWNYVERVVSQLVNSASPS